MFGQLKDRFLLLQEEITTRYQLRNYTNCDMPKHLFDYIICTYISTSLKNLIHIVQLCIFVRLTFIEVLCLLSQELVKFHL